MKTTGAGHPTSAKSKRGRPGGTAPRPGSDVTVTHEVTAGEPVTYETSGHPPRTDTLPASHPLAKQAFARVKG